MEEDHSYIQVVYFCFLLTLKQWLFPTFESPGANYYARPLTKQEAAAMRANLEVLDFVHFGLNAFLKISKRVIRAYRMMLHFYGMELLDEKTGY